MIISDPVRPVGEDLNKEKKRPLECLSADSPAIPPNLVQECLAPPIEGASPEFSVTSEPMQAPSSGVPLKLLRPLEERRPAPVEIPELRFVKMVKTVDGKQREEIDGKRRRRLGDLSCDPFRPRGNVFMPSFEEVEDGAPASPQQDRSGSSTPTVLANLQ
jgi:hypothetical protein